MRTTTILILLSLFILLFLFSYSVQATGGATGHLSDPSPHSEWDVPITAKGVQTCINVTVDANCTANVTFWWYNYSGGDAGGQWEYYAHLNNISSTQQVCFWDANVSCATMNWWNDWHFWRVVGNFTCLSGNYSESAFLWFNPEDCPLFYIYPPWNDTNICPCADVMCLGITNGEGHNMNITFFRNDTMNETFYAINRYVNVTNGTYCFCLDGHIDDIYYPMKYNESYHWYVNVTDVVSGDYNISTVYNFTTAENISDCPCGIDEIIALIEDTDTIRDDAWLVGIIIVFFTMAIVIAKKER